jgi:hypothetical protein
MMKTKRPYFNPLIPFKPLLIAGFLVTILTLTACHQGPEYRYQDQPKVVDCPGMSEDFMHELLYSFREDIGAFYNQYTDYIEGSKSYYFEAYKQYIYFSFSGTARFDDIASEHSRALLQELRKEEDFWIVKDGQERLNYSHPYLTCLIDGVADNDLRVSMQNLRQANSLTPELIAETMRINFQKVLADPNLAMYLALDGFYQPLINRSAKK